jgi:hypothetical protein
MGPDPQAIAPSSIWTLERRTRHDEPLDTRQVTRALQAVFHVLPVPRVLSRWIEWERAKGREG